MIVTNREGERAIICCHKNSTAGPAWLDMENAGRHFQAGLPRRKPEVTPSFPEPRLGKSVGMAKEGAEKQLRLPGRRRGSSGHLQDLGQGHSVLSPLSACYQPQQPVLERPEQKCTAWVNDRPQLLQATMLTSETGCGSWERPPEDRQQFKCNGVHQASAAPASDFEH